MYDYYLGSQEVDKTCIDAQSYGDSIPIDVADNFWNELDSKYIALTSTDTFEIPSYCDENNDGTITCSDDVGTFSCYPDGYDWVCGDYTQTTTIPSNCTEYGYGVVECYDAGSTSLCYQDQFGEWTDCYLIETIDEDYGGYSSWDEYCKATYGSDYYYDEFNDICEVEYSTPVDTTVFISYGSSSPGCEESNSCYLPNAVSVTVDSTVTWVNDDDTIHTVTSGTAADGPSGLFDSGLINPGGSFQLTFTGEGTSDYYCIIHPWKTGIVYVG